MRLSLKRQIRILLLFFITIAYTLPSSAQRDDSVIVYTPDKEYTLDFCKGHDMHPIESRGGVTQSLIPPTIPPGGSITCGKFRAIFMDVVNNTNYGFDDPNATLAQQRKNCVCDVLTYISSVIVIPANIGTSSPYIDIMFNNSISSGSYLGAATPVFPAGFQTNPGYYGGAVYQYITTGVKPNPLMEDGQITMNFGHPYEYCGTSFTNNCSYDFKSVVLHEMTHLLGMFSMASANSSGNLVPLIAPFVFSRFDQQFMYWENGGTLTKVVSNTLYAGNSGLNPTVNMNTYNTATSGINRMWLNTSPLTPTGARLNQPINSPYGFVQGTSFSHFQDVFYAQNWKSPGYVPNYVMSGSLRTRQFKTRYSLPELRMLVGLGYQIQSSYSDFPKIGNTPPYTNGYVASTVQYMPNGYMNTTPAAGNANLTIATTTCNPVTLNLATSTLTNGLTTQSLNLADPNDPVTSLTIFDNDPLTAGNQGVLNIRGCGNGNNTNQLTITNNNQIVFTPRPNFIGRAQYGFHLYDGDERGSYVVVTIDVSAGNCFVNNPINEVVVNGTMEQGIRVRNTTTPFVNLVEEIDYTHAYVFNMSPDGAQFVSPGWSDMGIRNSSTQCLYSFNGYCIGTCTGGGWGGPVPAFVNDRMMHASFGPLNESYNVHTSPITNCFTYRLEADIYIGNPTLPGSPLLNFVLHNQGVQVNPFPPLYAGSNQVIPFSLSSITPSTWHHISIPFNYTSANPSNFLFMDVSNAGGIFSLYYDNVSIKKVASTGPLTVTASPSNTFCAPGSVTLTASGGTSYTWSPATGLSSTTGATVVASPGTTTTYMVTATGAGTCNTSYITVNVTPPPTPTITATGVGTCNPQLTAGPTGVCFTYLWQGPNSFTATTPVINPIAAGVYTLTVTNTCTNNCSASTSYTLNMPSVGITASSPCLPSTLTATPMSGFTYTWSGQSSGSGNPFPITQAGTYIVTATNPVTGCTMQGSINFTPASACCASAYTSQPGSVLASNSMPPGGNVVPATANDLLAYFGYPLSDIITTNNYIVIDGNFIVNHNIQFVNCPNIVFSSTPQSIAKITVNPTYTLRIITSNLRAVCNYMWEGIESANSSSMVYISSSSIRDMIKGVVLKNNAPVIAIGNKFYDNYTGMAFQNIGTAYNATITDNLFYTASGLIPPYNGQMGKYGIHMFNVGRLKVGDIVSASGGNTFRRLWTGIYMRVNTPNFTQGMVELYNNHFEAITGGSVGLIGQNGPISLYNDPDGTPVFGINENIVPLIGYMVAVNYHPSCTNKFQGNTKAITLTGMSTRMSNTKQVGGIWGFMYNRTENRTYNISNCDQSNIYKGMEFVGSAGQGTISNNIITTSSSYPIAFNSVGLGLPTGINASFFSNTNNANFLFRDNRITLNAYGGKGINLENTGTGVNAFKNNIMFTTTLTSGVGDPALHGISMSNCNGTKAQANTIQGNNSTTNVNRQNIAGVFTSLSLNTILECNSIRQTKFGFLALGNCLTNKLNVRGNTTNTHFYGMYFRQLGQLGTFGDVGGVQGLTNRNNNNTFLGTYSGGFRVYRTGTPNMLANPRFWTPPSLLTQAQSSGTPISIRYGVLSNVTFPPVSHFNCPTNPVPLSLTNIAVVNDIATAEAIARNHDIYSDYRDIAQWIDAKELYYSLRVDTVAIDSSVVLDSFYTSMKTSVIARIIAANDIMDILSDTTIIGDTLNYTRMLSDAAKYNSVISGTHQHEADEKSMNTAYLKYLQLGDGDFSNEEKDAISTLANSCPLVYGTAVYKARMLYMAIFPSAEFDDQVLCRVTPRSGRDETGYGENDGIRLAEQFNIYPNPANDRITVEYEKAGALVITDVLGRVVQNVELPEGKFMHNIQLKNCIPGIYTYRYLVNNNTVNTGKLVIIQ